MSPALHRSLPAVEHAERTDPGRDPEKQLNEDACGYRETRFGHLCVVCDGMGGHAAGREAAELAVSTLFEVFQSAAEASSPPTLLRAAIEEASRRIHRMTHPEVSVGRPGSTLVAVLLHEGGTEVAHVGDSRAFLVHQGQIYRLTRDHSIVEEMVHRGILTPEQAAHHPDANRITRALGVASDVEAELRAQPVSHVSGDTFVLCSDGLSDLVEEREILAIVAGEPPAQAVGRLVDLANARGGHDNITVAVLRAGQTALAGATAVTPTLVATRVSVTEAPDTARTPGAAAFEPPPSPRATLPDSHPVALVPLHPDGLHAQGRRRPGVTWGPAALAGVVLAAVGVALLAAVILVHLADRRGKTSRPSSSGVFTSEERSP